MEAASLASTRDDETTTARTLRRLSRILNRVEVDVSLVTNMLHVLEELIKGKAIVSASGDGAMELRVKSLVLVADVLSQMVFPEVYLMAVYSTAGDECVLVLSRTLWPN
jgi:hypothetical protein